MRALTVITLAALAGCIDEGPKEAAAGDAGAADQGRDPDGPEPAVPRDAAPEAPDGEGDGPPLGESDGAIACPAPRPLLDIDAIAGDVVRLDARDVVPDGLRWAWVVVARPEGSTSNPVESYFNNASPADGGSADDDSTPTAHFFIDLAGHFAFELRVFRDGCDPAAVPFAIDTPVPPGFTVQLVWHTPSDPDETDDDGADLDLHLLHPNAPGWAESPFDCFSANPTPDWGQLEDARDDPALDVDDTDGAGPENITLTLPENTAALGAPYLVGVEARSDARAGGMGWGPSEATVRVWGAGAFVEASRVLAPGDRWIPFAVHAPPLRVERLDRLLEPGGS